MYAPTLLAARAGCVVEILARRGASIRSKSPSPDSSEPLPSNLFRKWCFDLGRARRRRRGKRGRCRYAVAVRAGCVIETPPRRFNSLQYPVARRL